MPVIRSAEEIEQVRVKAQEVAFAAEDAGDSDDVANAVYGTIQWLNGDSDTNPVEAYLS